jgi:NO-binding membrane sensor protein with MHYT domain
VTTTQVIEVLVAVALFALGVWQYRRRSAEDPNHGSQGAVILFVIAAIIAMHGLGLFEYRPSAMERNMAQ